MQIVSSADKMHEILLVLEKKNKEKYHHFVVCWIFPENGKHKGKVPVMQLMTV